MKLIKNILHAAIVAIGLSSCHTVNLFQNGEKYPVADLVKAADTTETLSPGDKLSLSVWQHDDLSVGSVFNIYNAHESFGKWVMVTNDSMVKLPNLGEFKIEGMTTHDLEDTITQILLKDIVNPIVVVKVLNREVTVLGEIKSPGNILLDKEKTSIVEVIGKSEGFLTYADVKKVQLIREGRSYIIDMSVMSEPLSSRIYVKSGDIINVPSLRGKKLDQKAPTMIPFASVATSLAVLISLILR